jgi:DNA-binding transcriptional regulator YdaS (Cro superfamily)
MTDAPILKEQALAAFGNNASRLARALGIKPSAVSQWKDGEAIPAKQALRLRYEIRPDLFGRPKAAA